VSTAAQRLGPPTECAKRPSSLTSSRRLDDAADHASSRSVLSRNALLPILPDTDEFPRAAGIATPPAVFGPDMSPDTPEFSWIVMGTSGRLKTNDNRGGTHAASRIRDSGATRCHSRLLRWSGAGERMGREKLVKDRHVSSYGKVRATGATASSLLEQLKMAEPEGWSRLVHLYGPLVYGWCRQMGLQSQDAADVVQEVYRVVATRISDFRRERTASFRSWLKTITRNKVLDIWRRSQREPPGAGRTEAQMRMAQMAEPDPEERNGDRYILWGGLGGLECEQSARQLLVTFLSRA